MLKTQDLYERPGYGIDFDDTVRFYLRRGLEMVTNEQFRQRFAAPSANRNANRTLVGRITSYVPDLPGDLEIRGLMDDGYTFRLRLTQCRNLQILEPEMDPEDGP